MGRLQLKTAVYQHDYMNFLKLNICCRNNSNAGYRKVTGLVFWQRYRLADYLENPWRRNERRLRWRQRKQTGYRLRKTSRYKSAGRRQMRRRSGRRYWATRPSLQVADRRSSALAQRIYEIDSCLDHCRTQDNPWHSMPLETILESSGNISCRIGNTHAQDVYPTFKKIEQMRIEKRCEEILHDNHKPIHADGPSPRKSRKCVHHIAQSTIAPAWSALAYGP